MSFDIYMVDKFSGKTLQVDHHFGGGTTIAGGYDEAWLNVTYNYSPHYYKHLSPRKGIRWIYGKTGKQVYARLKSAIDALGQDVSDNYWDPTEGNARKALETLLSWCVQHPKGVFRGD